MSSPVDPVGGVGIVDQAELRVRRRFESDPDPTHPMSDLTEANPVATIEALFAQEAPLLSEDDRRSRARALAVEILGLGAIQALLEDPEVTDVLVNGPGRVWVERQGRLEPSQLTVGSGAIMRSIERLVGPLGLSADRSNPIVDARLGDGARVTVVLPPLAPDGPLLAIRRHRAQRFVLESFAPEKAVTLLKAVVERALNVIVFGPTGSGKTSLVNAMAAEFPYGERVVTVEDTAELRLPGDHIVRLEARPGLADGAGRTDIRELVRASLRLRPDRIVVGEVRGPEAVDMIWAMSTGHRGSFSTCHASSPADALRRIETMVLLGAQQLAPDAVRVQVNSAVDVLVGMGRRRDGTRAVESVHSLDDDGTLTCLYQSSST